MVTGVTWQPYYDLHARTADGKPSSDVSLHYCANITQNTGEDWTNTVLTLSTANSHALHSLTVPKVDPLRLLPTRNPIPTGFAQQLQQQQQQQRSQEQQAMLFSQRVAQAVQQPVQAAPGGASILIRIVPLFFANGLHLGLFGMGCVDAAVIPPPPPVPRSSGPPPPPPPPPARGEEFEDYDVADDDDLGFITPESILELPEGSVLDESPLSLAYRIEGKLSLPSDGFAHKVSIAVLDFSAGLKYVCVPRKTSAAFIEGQIKNTSEYELLAGPVSVFMDDSFVTKTRLGVRRSLLPVYGMAMLMCCDSSLGYTSRLPASSGSTHPSRSRTRLSPAPSMSPSGASQNRPRPRHVPSRRLLAMGTRSTFPDSSCAMLYPSGTTAQISRSRFADRKASHKRRTVKRLPSLCLA